MAAIDQPLQASGGFPDLHAAIPGARSNKASVGRPVNGADHAVMAAIGQEVVSALCLPDLHSTVIAARSDELAIGRPRNGAQPIGMSVIGREHSAARGRFHPLSIHCNPLPHAQFHVMKNCIKASVFGAFAESMPALCLSCRWLSYYSGFPPITLAPVCTTTLQPPLPDGFCRGESSHPWKR
jgi:hypothetical protein